MLNKSKDRIKVVTIPTSLRWNGINIVPIMNLKYLVNLKSMNLDLRHYIEIYI